MAKHKTAKDIKVSDVSTDDSFALVIDLNGVAVEYGWENAFNDALIKLQRKVRGCYDYDYMIRTVGKIVTVTSHCTDVSGKKAIKALREVVKVAPKLHFQVDDVDNEDGSSTTTVYYDGQLSTRSHVDMPATPAGVSVNHNQALQKVVITLANPLFSLPEDFVTEVKAALQAQSVNPPSNS